MKAFKSLLLILMLAAAHLTASAQYYQIANQLSNLIQPALSGSLSYRGFVELSGTAGIGTNRANILGISTTQGFQYSSWFFMGAGIGVDLLMTNPDESLRPSLDNPPSFMNHGSTRTAAMIPLFTDFRFKIGGQNNSPAAFIDIKTGATWLMGNDYLEFSTARLGGGTQFYLRPAIGVRIPISAKDNRKAVNVGVTYQLITSNNWYTYNNGSVTLNGFGATVAYEW